MNDELKRTWNEAAVAYLNELFRHSSGDNDITIIGVLPRIFNNSSIKLIMMNMVLVHTAI
jgi:hypothetical protein